MCDKSMRRICAAVMIVCFAVAGFGTPVVAAQFGAIKEAARKAKEEMQRKKDAEAQAQKEAEAKKEAEKKEAEAKKEAPAGAPAAAPAGGSAQPQAGAAQPAPADAAASFQAFSKFDFVPGEKIVAFEDFTQDAIGDFPAKWNTNASGEVVTIAGKPGRWLKLAGSGFYTPEFITALPEDFTLEFDILTPPTFNGYYLNAVIAELPSAQLAGWSTATNAFLLSTNPGSGGDGSAQTVLRQNSNSAPANSKYIKQFTKVANPVHISLWRQRQRMRVYFNEEKLWDLP